MSVTDAETVATVEEQPQPQRRRGRFLRRFLALTGLLLLLVYVAPLVVAHTPLLDYVVSRTTADLQGTARVKSASLGWFSPVRIRGVEVHDAFGQPVFTATEVSGDKSLARMLLDFSDLGEFRIEQPEVHLVVRPDGTNVEDLLATYLQEEEEPEETEPTAIGVRLIVVGGTLSLKDDLSKQTWKLRDLELAMALNTDGSVPLLLETSATIDDPDVPGRVAATMSMPLGGKSESDLTEDNTQLPAAISVAGTPVVPAPKGKADLNIEAFPLAMLDSLFARFAPGTRLLGDLNSEMHVTWGDRIVVQSDLKATGVTVVSPALGTDRVRLNRLDGGCEISIRGDRIEIVRSSIDCDVANLSANGVFNMGGEWIDQLPASALKQTCEIKGRVDLAKLAKMLPNTLRVREETEITSGEIQLALVSRPNMPDADTNDAVSATFSGMVWQGHLEAANFVATDQGRKISWDRPILMTLAAHETPQGPVVDELKCESDFLKIHAAGTLANLSAAASFDLSLLAKQLGQFVDLSEIQLAGNGWANFNWKYTDKEPFEADVDLQLRDFRLTLSEGRTWVEPELLLFLSATGQTDFGNDTQLHTATLRARAGSELVDAQLTQPVLDFRRGGNWPVKFRTQGQFQNWPRRLRSWVDLGQWSVVGKYDIAAEAVGSIDGVTVRDAAMSVEPFRLRGPGVNVAHSKLDVSFSGTWDQPQRKLHLQPASLEGDHFSMAASHLTLALPDQKPIELQGEITVEGHLQQILAWFADPKTPPARQMAGKVSAKANIRQTGHKMQGKVDAMITNFSVKGEGVKPFREPKVHLVADGGYDTTTSVLSVKQLTATSSMLGATGNARLAPAGKAHNLNFNGNLQYDCDKLSALLATYIGPGIHFAGAGDSPATWRGPLSLSGGRANLAMEWKWAKLYGFPIGGGQFQCKMADGVVQMEPTQATASGGTMHLAPRIQLNESMLLTMPEGPLLTQVQITPQMCESFMKYIAPVMAGVTAAEGVFSIELEHCQVPLTDWTKSDIAGRLTVHTVEIGAGPLIKEFAMLVGYNAPGKLRRESVVPFRMVDGRVYHQNLELEFPDLTIRTSGSVGIDQTISLMAEMPVPPKWIGNNQLGTALRDQIIRIPITGTLNKPQLDRNVMNQFNRQFMEKAAGNLIKDELQKHVNPETLKGLEGLFRPR